MTYLEPISHLCQSPVLLILPGSEDAKSDDSWSLPWKEAGLASHHVDVGIFDAPKLNTWVNRLNLEIHRADRPVILVANDLACLVVAWWAEFEQPSTAHPVVGAIFVDPPDIDRPGRDPRLARLHAFPCRPLPFPSFVVARNDLPVDTRSSLVRLSQQWGSGFVEDHEPEQAPDERTTYQSSLRQILLRRLVPHPVLFETAAKPAAVAWTNTAANPAFASAKQSLA